MQLKFTKMHGLGNDFVVFNGIDQRVDLSSEQAAHIADRHLGVGCDQILIVENSERADIDFRYRIINADGSEVGQCGNGARCFMRYIHDQGLSNKGMSQDNPLKVATLAGEMTLFAEPDSQHVVVAMGIPKFQPPDIPLNAPQQQSQYQLEIDDATLTFAALSIGNPHAVLHVDDIHTAAVSELGAQLESHPIFPAKANIGFMQINTRNDIDCRVFERGVGETSACGSGACAAVVAGIKMGQLDKQVTVHLTGGDLFIRWAGEGHTVMMTGPAQTAFEGTLTLQP